MAPSDYLLIIADPNYGKTVCEFNGSSAAPSWTGLSRPGHVASVSYSAGIWRFKFGYTAYSIVSMDGSLPPTTGWPPGYSVTIVPLSGPPASPNTLPVPALVGFSALLTTNESHDVAFSLKDGTTVTAHRLILEAQAPTLYTLASEATGVDDPVHIPYDRAPFSVMLSITYGNKPSPDLKPVELVKLLHVSNYCGAVASKIHVE
jgi:hypothetical protein